MLQIFRLPSTSSRQLPTSWPSLTPIRHRGQLAPKRVANAKAQKGRVPIPIGGSIKGTTLAFGQWGIRVKGDGVRMSAKQLTVAEDVLKQKMKIIKGARVYMRVFPQIPVCIKGSEVRMGKGKGTFEYWACRVPKGKVVFEIGGAPIREEYARDALRQAACKLPSVFEFISRESAPRLGDYLVPPESIPTGPPNVPITSSP